MIMIRCQLQNYILFCTCLLLGIEVHARSSDEVFAIKDCKEINLKQKCQCAETNIGKFDIHCPVPIAKTNELFNVSIVKQRMVINCNRTNVNVYEYLPQLFIGDSNEVWLVYCPFLEQTYFLDIFTKWKINNTVSLNGRGTGSVLQRKHLYGLPPELKTISLQHYNISKLSANIVSNFKFLINLDLRYNQITQMHTNTFVTLEKLKELQLSYNHIKYIPDGIFRKQNKLLFLELQNNQLQNLNNDTFLGCNAINYLCLSENFIESMEAETFAPLFNLEHLYITKNNLSQFPIGIFANNKQLKQIVLSDNNIKYLQHGIFRNQKRLENLDLQNNQLRSLEKEALLGANNIIKINVNGNDIENIEADTFSALNNLQNLYLDKNSLKQLPNLTYNTNLKVISFSDNRVPIKTLPANIFHNQSHIESISLSCKLESIDKTIFLQKLAWHMNLSHNALTNVPELLSGMIYLKTLDLSYNYLQMLPNYFFSYMVHHHLEELILSHNKLTKIPIHGSHHFSDRKIDLSYNNITILDHAHISFLSKISKVVNLSHNQIREVNFIKPNSNLYIFDKFIDIHLNTNPLNCNCKLLNFVLYIQSIQKTRQVMGPEYKGVINFIIDELRCEEPEYLKGRHANSLMPLELLCLLDSTESAKLVGYSGKCRYFKRTYDSVLIVNCSNGNMTKLTQLPALEQLNLHSMELHINNNRLTELPSNSMWGYKNVTQVHAARNNLSQIEMYNLPSNLSHLDLRHNQLTHLSENVLNYLNQSRTLKSINLSRNPWICDCEAKLFLQFIKDKQKQISDLHAIRCANPGIELKLFELSVTDICPPSKAYIYVLVVTTTIGSLIAITSLFYNKYEKYLKIWLYSHNILLWFVTEEELDKDKAYDAFISYSHCDEQFIANHLAPQLEQGPIKFKLCIHVRDWLIGSTIPNNIMRSINESRRTIFILTNNFIKSTWSRLEFQVAHQASLEEKRSRIILILFDDIGNIEGLDEELAAYLRMNTYLQWGDPWFWDKLRYAMPHRSEKGIFHNHSNYNEFELNTIC